MQIEKNIKPDYVSYSSIKDFKFCPFYYKLTRIDKITSGGDSIHTAFGKALHKTAENIFKQEKEGSFDYQKDFSDNFDSEISSLSEVVRSKLIEKDLKEFNQQGRDLAVLVFPVATEYFGEFEFISAEESLMEDIVDYKIDDFKFKGYIDLIIKTKKDGIYHIIDWKTCSWGWDLKKKSDTMLTYQLTYYKYFFSKKLNVSVDKIQTHFGLLKRTAKKDRVEIFDIACGEKKIGNALKLLQESIFNIDHDRFMKNRLSCERCVFRKTIHCP